MRDDSRLHLGLVPWSIVDDQNAERANNGNRNRSNQRRAAASPHLIFARMNIRHFNAAARFPLTESNPGDNEGSPLLPSAGHALAERISCPCIVWDQAQQPLAALLSELQNVNTETPSYRSPGWPNAPSTPRPMYRARSRRCPLRSGPLSRSQRRDRDGAATGKAACDHQRNHPRSAARQPVRRLFVRDRGRTTPLALSFGARCRLLRISPSLRPWLPT